MKQRDLSKKFDKQANLYKKERQIKLLKRWRSKLISHAKGEVLELAVGAGGNFPFYPKGVHVTAVDISPKMLIEAGKAADEEAVNATFILGNNEELLFSKNAFDTIVSTLSFCGYEQPTEMLEKLNRWCKPGGRILLLEHGISERPCLARVQEAIDSLHVRMIGCHQTRDIRRLLDESPLERINHETHLQDIFHVIWAHPKVESETKQ